jgi:hypothetical protein
VGQVHHAEAVSGEAKVVAADPGGVARSTATDAGMREAQERAPVDPAGVRADVDATAAAVDDPAAAGEAHVKVEVDAELDPTKKR